MVTHDPQAAAYGDRIIRIRDGLMESDCETGADQDAQRMVLYQTPALERT
jgi:ABC-type lipoprotein export system ATPase subunit